MPIQYQQTTDREIHEQVRVKHKPFIHQLQALGFAEYSFFGETVQAFGFIPLGVLGVLGALIALFKEVSKIESNLDVTIFNVVMASREYATYAGPFGLGTKFYTSFTDGSCIISANFETPAINDEKEKLYKFARTESIASTWSGHKKWVEKLCSEGKQKVEHLSFADYLTLIQREDNYMLRIKNRTVLGDAGSMFNSTIISASLFAAVALMFWFLPRLVHSLYPSCWFVRNADKPSLLIILLLIPALLALSWFLARFQQTPFTVDGVGTRFFGQSPSADSSGYISTKWLVVVLLPLIPVRSHLIVEEDVPGQRQAGYSMRPLEKLHWEQIRETAWRSTLGYLIFVLLLASFGIWAFRECM